MNSTTKDNIGSKSKWTNSFYFNPNINHPLLYFLLVIFRRNFMKSGLDLNSLNFPPPFPTIIPSYQLLKHCAGKSRLQGQRSTSWPPEVYILQEGIHNHTVRHRNKCYNRDTYAVKETN